MILESKKSLLRKLLAIISVVTIATFTAQNIIAYPISTATGDATTANSTNWSAQPQMGYGFKFGADNIRMTIITDGRNYYAVDLNQKNITSGYIEVICSGGTGSMISGIKNAKANNQRYNPGSSATFLINIPSFIDLFLDTSLEIVLLLRSSNLPISVNEIPDFKS